MSDILSQPQYINITIENYRYTISVRFYFLKFIIYSWSNFAYFYVVPLELYGSCIFLYSALRIIWKFAQSLEVAMTGQGCSVAIDNPVN